MYVVKLNSRVGIYILPHFKKKLLFEQKDKILEQKAFCGK
jgi:hypothetical protein